MTANLREQLESALGGRVCFMGLGNVNGGDDGLGVRLAEALIGAGVPDVVIAGTNPEEHVGRCAEAGFDHIVLLDATSFGAAPGSAVFLNSEEIVARFPQVSTHQLSLGLLAKYIEAGGRARAWLLGVQPASLRPASGLSPVVQATLAILVELLCGVMSEEIKA